jgi:N-acetylmuramoyl-L-alanine amidase
VEVGYLSSVEDRQWLVDPEFRDRVGDAVVAAVKRMYLPVEADVPTGSIDVSALRTATRPLERA